MGKKQRSGSNHVASPHQRRNYWCFVVEGGSFLGGMSFIGAETVLPAMVEELGGSRSLIAYLPVLMWVGILGPSLFVAHRVENLDRIKPYVMFWTLLQRLPFPLAGLILFFFGQELPNLALAAVVAAPFLSGIMGGMSLPGWFTLTGRTIGARRRSSAGALRNLIGSGIGFGAGFAVDQVMSAYPGEQGYAMLHFITAALMVISWLFLGGIKEAENPHPMGSTPRTMFDTFRSIPELLRARPRIACLLSARFFSTGYFLVVPFLSVHALEVTGEPRSFVGSMVSAQMIGGLAGNITAGIIGDRYGAKGVAFWARILFLLLLGLFSTAESSWVYLLIFGIWGFVFQSQQVSEQALMLELSEGARMPSYVAISNFGYLCGLLISSSLASLLSGWFDGMLPLIAVATPAVLVGAVLLWRIKDPRHDPAS